MTTQRIHQGTLFLDQNNRYCLCEPGRPTPQMVTITSGCELQVLLNGQWVTGHAWGDGSAYWLFIKTGGRLKLAARMTVRYLEPCWYTPNGQQPLSLLAD